ncbi:MRG/MORF4L-binding protein [Dendroctonus ponderosae]|uniref:MRG-binding protein n=1 Tax=Dendroctonus ponderosae TaxID=77166 RepID=A0AAR5Q6R3_DENPD|nr:MRG/MORF4L-binding protein [Dendroctonus ponderosae]KAH1000653.1 hypothetical protein HUJ04_012958 [Dendroctonus ponderosae]KAH1006802.1 hypothetical protein HUJ05_007505 [Dendroctonus ponderosae]
MEDIEWTVVNEGQLLDAMVGHKPVGVNKYFQMALICDKFADNLRKDVNPQKVWAHLETMYNLEALDENETIPFPNKEKEFTLPQSEFGELLVKKEDEEKKGTTETPKLSTKEAKKEDKGSVKQPKDDTPRRDSKDSNKSLSSKKEAKKDTEKVGKQLGKGRNPGTPKEGKSRSDDTPKLTKRTRGSLKSNDDSGSSGKSSPVTITPATGKRRRIV